jgi:hypothetical protein
MRNTARLRLSMRALMLAAITTTAASLDVAMKAPEE